MNIVIRKIKENEYQVLEDFLYEAIFIPEGIEKPSRDIIKNKELQVYIKNFGMKDDNCLVALDNNTPSLAISLYEEYRSKGIGTKLMNEMKKLLKEKGYQKTSLAVQKKNYAVNMYKKVGFKTIDENEEEYIMICDLKEK